MPREVFGQDFGVGAEVRIQDAANGRAKFGVRQYRAERAMQDLPAGSGEAFADRDVGPHFQIRSFEILRRRE